MRRDRARPPWGNEDDPVGEGAAELAAHLGFGSAELEAPAPLAIDLPHVPAAVVRPADEAGVPAAFERADAGTCP